MSPSPRLLRIASAGLLIAALPVLVHESTWILWAAGWVVLLVILAIELLSLRGAIPQLAVELPRSVGVGEPARVALELRAPAARAVPLTLRAETSGAIREGEDLRLTLEREATVTLELLAPSRGRSCLEAVWVRAEGRFGLLSLIRRLEVEADTRVIPSLPAVRRLTVLPQIGGAQVGGIVMPGHGDGTEFDELQVYASGMDTRAIDWKASARHLELRVRRFRPEQNQRVIVAVDAGRSMLERIGELSRLDHAIHTALALAKVALRAGDQVGLHAYGVRPRAWVRPASGMSQLRKLLRCTAELHADERESNPVHGVRDLLSRLRRRSLIVLLSDLRDPTATELLIEALATLARRHLVILVALSDPETHDPLAGEPVDLAHVTRVVVRDELASERKLALERLRGRGVHVLAAEPGAAALLVLRRYFHVKRRGRL